MGKFPSIDVNVLFRCTTGFDKLGKGDSYDEYDLYCQGYSDYAFYGEDFDQYPRKPGCKPVEMLFQYSKEVNTTMKILYKELSDQMNEASKSKTWNVTKVVLDFLKQKAGHLNETKIEIDDNADEEWKYIVAMIKLYTQINMTPNINDWWANNQEDHEIFFLVDRMKKNNMSNMNLGSVFIKTLNLINYKYSSCFTLKSYIDQLHELFTIKGQNVSLPDIAYLYSITDFNALTKDAVFTIDKNGESAWEPPTSLINMKESFVTCFKNVANNESTEVKDKIDFIKGLKSKNFMKKSPCRKLDKSTKCIEYCNWHERIFKEWGKDEFLTVMRYALPQRKIILDPIGLHEESLAKILFGPNSLKNLTQKLAPMSMPVFCYREDVGFIGDDAGLSEKMCNDFFPMPTDSGICLTRNLDINEVLHKNEQYNAKFEADIQLKNEKMEAKSLWSTTTLVIFTDYMNSIRQTYPRNQDSKVGEIQFQLHQSKELGQMSENGDYDFHTNSITLKAGHEYYFDVTPIGQKSTENLKILNIEQRNCSLEGELNGLSMFKKYSINNCKYECHVTRAKNECQCIPWDFVNNGTTTMDECDVFGRTCFFNWMENLAQSPIDHCSHCIKGKCLLCSYYLEN